MQLEESVRSDTSSVDYSLGNSFVIAVRVIQSWQSERNGVAPNK